MIFFYCLQGGERFTYGAVMYNLENFSLRDMVECAASHRKIGIGAENLLTVTERVVRFFYDNFRLIDRTPSCALVRFFKTHPYDELDGELQQYVRQALGGPPEHVNISCMTLIATAGEKPSWNKIEKSQQHRAIPLGSEQMLKQSPMISQLIKQLGVNGNAVLQPRSEL